MDVFGIIRRFVAQDLHRDGFVQREVVRVQDEPETPRTDRPVDTVLLQQYRTGRRTHERLIQRGVGVSFHANPIVPYDGGNANSDGARDRGVRAGCVRAANPARPSPRGRAVTRCSVVR